VLYYYAPPLVAESSIPLTVYIESKYALESYVKGQGQGKSLAITTSIQVLNTPELAIVYKYSSKKRTLNTLNSGADACVVNKLKTAERADKYLFTNPISLYYGQRLYYSDSSLLTNINIVNEEGEVDIVKLFSALPDSTLMLKLNTSYGDKIDKLLTHIPRKNIRYSGENIPQLKLFELLERQRADFIISYPLVKAQTSTEAKVSYGALIANTNQYALGRIMCSKSTTMKRVIAALNRKISQLHRDSVLFNIHQSKLHSSDFEQFAQDYRRAFK